MATAKQDPLSTVKRYDEAWADTDPVTRRETLRSVWADDGVYIDPDVPEGVRGADELAALIGASLAQYPGLEIAATSDLSVLGDRAWYRWRATLPAAESFSGADFFEFAPDGRIARVTNFFDR